MKSFLALLLPLPLFSQLAISPLTPVVKQGTSQTFTGSGGTGPYTYSLRTGSVGSINATTGAYTAPAHVTVHNQAHGVQIGSNSSVWNTRIDAAPVHAKNTDWWINNANIVNGPGISIDFPINNVASTDPATSLLFAYTPGHNGSFIYPALPFWQFETGYYTWDIQGQDRHSFSITKDTGHVYEIYNYYPAGFNLACLTCTSQSGLSYDGMDPTLSTDGTTDAAGLPITPLMIKYDELLTGNIQHALRWTWCVGCISGNRSPWPGASFPDCGPAPTYAGCGSMPYVTRLRLKSAFTPSYTADCNAGCQAIANGLFNAMKQYGLFVADVGPEGDIQSERGPMNMDMVWALRQMIQPVKADFEIIDESALVESATSAEVLWNNGIVTPSDSAEACVTDATAATVCTRIRLQGVTIGTEQRYITIAAGTPAYQLKGWVQGSSNGNINWTMSPAVGTLNASTGSYTAPASVLTNTKQTTMITLTSAADPAVSTTIGVTILPSPIRINFGDTSDYLDSSGNKWFAEFVAGDPILAALGADKCGMGFPCGDQNQASWTGSYDAQLFRNSVYNYGDKYYRLVVPNGTYSVSFMQGENAGTPVEARTANLEVQGTAFKTRYDVVADVGTGVEAVNTTTATVSNNELFIAWRWKGVTPQSANPCCNVPLWSQGYAPSPAALLVSASPPPPPPSPSSVTSLGGAVSIVGRVSIQ